MFTKPVILMFPTGVFGFFRRLRQFVEFGSYG